MGEPPPTSRSFGTVGGDRRRVASLVEPILFARDMTPREQVTLAAACSASQ
ncbi:hypothetical protein P3L51_11920 [Streptomyces sp. PSRA5]|uniref:hypothetical protein n=1 Tax=Streptomyces panacea TaxID=3035064 RepID=UPI00339BF81E